MKFYLFVFLLIPSLSLAQVANPHASLEMRRDVALTLMWELELEDMITESDDETKETDRVECLELMGARYLIERYSGKFPSIEREYDE